ncbi:MAG: homoserine kinase [Actinomycetota bacterium]|nr:homoserine kinase [Actinomycetota bacterium]
MADGPTIRVPASSANLGPGFDALGLALTAYLDFTLDGYPVADESHLAVRTFRRAGGRGPVAVRCEVPGGRGLGFSAAARVAGLLGAAVQQGKLIVRVQGSVLREATELEGHADNAAAAVHGGLVAVAGGTFARVPLAVDVAVVVWIPDRETSTKTSRGQLGATVPFDDAVFNIGHTALMVAALAAGDVGALRVASEDRLHQNMRLARVPDSHHALRTAVEAGAWCAYLSGSGPSIAALAAPGRHAEAVAAALAPTGRTMILGIDHEGARVQ